MNRTGAELGDPLSQPSAPPRCCPHPIRAELDPALIKKHLLQHRKRFSARGSGSPDTLPPEPETLCLQGRGFAVALTGTWTNTPLGPRECDSHGAFALRPLRANKKPREAHEAVKRPAPRTAEPGQLPTPLGVWEMQVSPRVREPAGSDGGEFPSILGGPGKHFLYQISSL